MTDALFKTEAEIAELVGIDLERWPHVAVIWERRGFPQARVQTGKRYWPAVKAWLDRDNGLGQSVGLTTPDPGIEGEDHEYARTGKRRARA